MFNGNQLKTINIKLKLSIITINYNNLDGLKKTVASVHAQLFKDYEYLIIDGNSTDGGKTYVESNRHLFEYAISEPDTGIYDAMNKGIAKAKGDYCLFLNSGDYLLDERVLQSVFDQAPTESILYGDLRSNHRDYTYDHTLTLNSLYKGTIPHQASFIKTALFKDYGGYDETYPIIADWVFFVQMILVHQVSYRHLGMYISFFEHGGISTQSAHTCAMDKERSALLMGLFPRIFPDYVAMSTKMERQDNELNAYKNSRLIQALRVVQKKVLGTR